MQIEKNPLWRIGKHPLFWGCLLLTAVTVLNNWPMAAFGFAWDDYGYVVKNYPIQDPVSLKSLLWCLTAFAEANWHPMTWLALHLQFQLFGLNSGGYHVTNLLLHIANTLLLYALLYRTTRAVGKSLFVAAIFSVHPLHIESVAWISEIKDVLSTFFFLLMLHAYVGYAKHPGLWRYGLVGVLLALGLASKPMLVTAPFVMLLLDYWPLGRWTGGPEAVLPHTAAPRFSARRLILEKLPFLAMVGVVCILTFLAQREGGAVIGLSAVPILMRLSNVANSYVMYVWRTFWPWPLSFFYPYEQIPTWRLIICVVTLTALSFLTWKIRRIKPYLLFGWLWFLGTLVPVIGIVQVGSQSMADRYMYLPSIGLIICITWLLADIRKKLRLSLLLPTTLSVAVLLASMCISLDYLLNWRSDEDLYAYGIKVNEDNYIAHNNFAIILTQRNKRQEAKSHFNRNIKLAPNASGGRSSLAALSLGEGDPAQALEHILPDLTLNPSNSLTFMTLGLIFDQVRDDAMAEQFFKLALQRNPPRPQVPAALAALLIRQRRYDEALDLINEQAPRLHDREPIKAILMWCTGLAYLHKGLAEQSHEAFREALRLQPTIPNGYHGLARLAFSQQNPQAAIDDLKIALRTLPNDPTARALLGKAYEQQGHNGKAYVQLRRALDSRQGKMDENDAADAHLGLSRLSRLFGQEAQADQHAARAHDYRTVLRPNGMPALRQHLMAAHVASPRAE
ncbi:MAG: hypothetical protein B193_1149 [Solidesulfovibrio magneticus str. Maddingley MBC34]|uniref:Uncharacterized protein n=1 Tax=Solidesulfovibrio magneticus str. Maddingley MBC34 TaxID=1206767 RepID=K6GT94_9BACT|nr:MAG: hypothetical protein B193_1149 [Solidesulfovibrio magneticus str. Maddingley MBC34]